MTNKDFKEMVGRLKDNTKNKCLVSKIYAKHYQYNDKVIKHSSAEYVTVKIDSDGFISLERGVLLDYDCSKRRFNNSKVIASSSAHLTMKQAEIIFSLLETFNH